ncbi:hypothetical protein [Streptomyces sp. NPDC089919]|uniref:hypothetical protein n=1 Tax=Streptomyces sp. NPDC089919 TaxID=3155188 RepID=UPI0034399DED
MPASTLQCVLTEQRLICARIIVVVVVIIAVLSLVRQGYEAGSALALIAVTGTTALELAQRLVSGARPARGRRTGER